MAIYEIAQDMLVPAPVTSFQAAGLRERADIQRLLRDKIEKADAVTRCNRA